MSSTASFHIVVMLTVSWHQQCNVTKNAKNVAISRHSNDSCNVVSPGTPYHGNFSSHVTINTLPTTYSNTTWTWRKQSKMEITGFKKLVLSNRFVELHLNRCFMTLLQHEPQMYAQDICPVTTLYLPYTGITGCVLPSKLKEDVLPTYSQLFILHPDLHLERLHERLEQHMEWHKITIWQHREWHKR